MKNLTKSESINVLSKAEMQKVYGGGINFERTFIANIIAPIGTVITVPYDLLSAYSRRNDKDFKVFGLTGALLEDSGRIHYN